jgi:DNA invertase Pin-like site-specific DNA recombinase
MGKPKQLTSAIIYARGVLAAVEKQLEACRAYAARRGLKVAAEVVEFKSASEHQAAGLAKLMQQVDALHPEVVIVADLSRLSRRLTDLTAVQQWLAERHVQLAALASLE